MKTINVGLRLEPELHAAVAAAARPLESAQAVIRRLLRDTLGLASAAAPVPALAPPAEPAPAPTEPEPALLGADLALAAWLAPDQ